MSDKDKYDLAKSVSTVVFAALVDAQKQLQRGMAGYQYQYRFRPAGGANAMFTLKGRVDFTDETVTAQSMKLLAQINSINDEMIGRSILYRYVTSEERRKVGGDNLFCSVYTALDSSKPLGFTMHKIFYSDEANEENKIVSFPLRDLGKHSVDFLLTGLVIDHPLV